MPNLAYEKALWNKGIPYVAGVDEAGRGPLAGPVVAAAVIVPQHILIKGIDDSKKLSHFQRNELFAQIIEKAISVGIGVVDNTGIDSLNILNASLEAMRLAIAELSIKPNHLLIDGNIYRNHEIPFSTIVKGDSKSVSIAAASIIAKVTRDTMMQELDIQFPQYGFAKHKGYPTKAHVEAINKFGICEIHRKSFSVKGWGNKQ